MIKMRILRVILLIGVVFWAGGLSAQTIFEMSDTTVSECQGILLDSEDGQGGNYDHNENITFTICPPGGVDSITLDWLSFCTEGQFDYLRIFLGTDTFGTLIAGPFSDTIAPPSITVPGCLTVNFISDANVACTGWIAQWQVYETIPTPAQITLQPIPVTCSTATINVSFDKPVHCDSIVGSNFTLTGPAGQISSANATACSNDSATTGVINFNPSLNQSGTYTVDFTTFYRDACDSLWELTSSDVFTITDCPLAVVIDAQPDTICPGGCTDLTAIASGGDSLNYTYAWSNGLPPTLGPHTVCPLVNTTYSVTVTDGSPAPPAINTVTIVVLPPPATQPDFSICQSEPAQTLTANPGGGTWSGPGILNPTAGTFLPDSAGPGVHDIIYTLPNGCSDTLVITVQSFDAGPPEAACPGTAPFNVSGFTPAGGTWSGPNITPGGLFNPVAAGNYTVTYTLGACSDTKIIRVQNITVPMDTNLCSSADTFTLAYTPVGGTWGIGSQGTQAIYDNPRGLIDPGDGDTVNVLVYSINGCSDSLVVSIFQIDAGNNVVTCPKADPLIVKDSLGTVQTTPLGGTWSGTGILNPVTGLFDPSVNNQNWNATITYTFGGCTATKFVYVRVTDVSIDTLDYCRDDSSILTLSYANTGRTPGGGQWTGPNLLTTGQNATVRPADLGVGLHMYQYEVYGCPDSFHIQIRPPNTLTDTSICELEPAFPLLVSPTDHPAGGTWTGNGVTSPQGTFDPQTAGVGTWPIYYNSYYGCNDTSQITVFPPPVVSISGLDPNYCYVDTVIPLTLMPPGGLLTGTGLVGNGFNPSLAGPGTHQLTYTYGDGACTRTDFIFTTVGIPLNMTLNSSDDTICIGQQVQLNVQAFGGTGSNYDFIWNQGLGNSPSHTIQPNQSGTYQVIVSDGCTDQVMDSVSIVVRQPYSVAFDTSNIQCFGETGFAVALPSIPGSYTYEWDTDPPTFNDTLFAEVRNEYSVTVADSGSGCVVSRSVTIPGYPAIRANFTSNPSTCALLDDPVFDIIDLSNGVDFGLWDFGDGAMEPYAFGINPIHRYDQIGTYQVVLTVENIGQCTDTFSLEVCIDPAELIYYGSFSPNGDGVNDVFEIDFIGAFPNNSLQVFNRYGNIVYEASPYNNDWNGVSNKTGEVLPDGAYFYIFDKGEGSEKKAGDVVIIR